MKEAPLTVTLVPPLVGPDVGFSDAIETKSDEISYMKADESTVVCEKHVAVCEIIGITAYFHRNRLCHASRWRNACKQGR